MKKITKRIGQALIGAATTATLLAGRALAATDPAVTNGTTDGTTITDGTGTTNITTPIQDGASAARGDGMPAELIGPDGIFTRITNTILYAVGVISVVMLIWGGIRYVTSGGDSKKVTDAKNTILYAIIGLIIAILSYAIVNFIISAVGGTPTPAPAQ
jgi:hypothetical protein